MKTGILTSGVSQNLEKALNIIRSDGFDHVEIQYAWGIEDGSRSNEQEDRIQRLLKQNHMTCTAIMRNIFSGLELENLSPDAPDYQKELHHLRNSIALAKSYGCNITRINSFNRHHVVFGYGGAEHYFTNDNSIWVKFLRLMEPVCQIAEDEQITIAIETGTNGFLHTASLMQKALTELNCNKLMTLWDPANCLYSSEIPYPDGYEKLQGKIAEIHIKDLRISKELATITYCPLGQGLMAAYLKDLALALQQDHFQGSVILENQVTPNGGTEEDGYHLSVSTFRDIFAENTIKKGGIKNNDR